MKKFTPFIIFIFIIFCCAKSYGQQVTNVASYQEGKKLKVTYNLAGKQGVNDYEIKLYVSTDDGSSWQQLNSGLSGDIGTKITPGAGKTITWDVLATRERLQGDKIRFKVTATFNTSGNYTEALTGSASGIEMVFVKGGTFTMGSPSGETNRESDEVQHTVTVSNFYMGKTEVTFAQYDAFCDATGRSKPSDAGWGRGTRPVLNVSWNDATAFCEWLSNKTGKTYRLPTEAEWEYACRAGTTTPFNTGNCLSSSQANYDGNYPLGSCSKGEYMQKTLPVGSFSPNAYGLYDMHGNVWEWCSDWYGEYSSGSQTNPKGPSSGSFRVYRGGSWRNDAQRCRSANRSSDGPGSTNRGLGFRVVRVP